MCRPEMLIRCATPVARKMSQSARLEVDIKVENSDNKLRTESVQTKSRDVGEGPNLPTLKLELREHLLVTATRTTGFRASTEARAQMTATGQLADESPKHPPHLPSSDNELRTENRLTPNEVRTED